MTEVWLSEDVRRMAAEYAAARNMDPNRAVSTLAYLALGDRVMQARQMIRMSAGMEVSAETKAVAAIRLPGETT